MKNRSNHKVNFRFWIIAIIPIISLLVIQLSMGNPGAVSAYETIPLESVNHEVSYWKLDEISGTTADDSWDGNDGTVSGGIWTTGKVGGALSFDGVDDIVEVPDSSNLRITGPMAIEAWFKLDSPLDTATLAAPIAAKWGAAGGTYPAAYGLHVLGLHYTDFVPVAGGSEGKIAFTVSSNGGDISLVATPWAAESGTWYYVVGQFTGTAIQLWVNGIMVSEQPFVAGIYPSNAPLVMGNYDVVYSTHDGPMDGSIDEVKIYNRVLTGEEILRNSKEVGQVSYWKLDEISGTTAYDSWDGNDGTVSGGTWTAGKVGRAMSFTGIPGERIEVPDSSNLRITGHITVEAWLSFDEITNIITTGPNVFPYPYANAPIVAKWGASSPGNTAGYALAIFQNGVPYFDISTSGSDFVYVPAPYPIPRNTFTHLAGVWTGTEVQLYVNGVLVNSAPSLGPINPTEVPVEIGAYNPEYSLGHTESIKGIIDEVKIYNCALTGKDILNNYQKDCQVSYWKLDEISGTTADDSWDGNDGTVSGGIWTTGKVGGALSFDGVDDIVEVPDSSNLRITGPMAIEAWFKLDSPLDTATLAAPIAAKWGAAGGTYPAAYGLHVLGLHYTDFVPVAGGSEGKIAFTVSSNGGDISLVATPWAAEPGTWYYVVGQFTGTAIQLWVNGIMVSEQPFVAGIYPSNAPLVMGNYDVVYSTHDGPMDGSIDEVKIYNRALSGEEIAKNAGIYNIIATAGIGGSITPSGNVLVNQGAAQSFTITAITGYQIDGVVIDGILIRATGSYMFTNVQSNHTITATFVMNYRTITASAGVNGYIMPSGNVIVHCGESKTFSITANTGYHITNVVIDGTSVGAVTSYKFNNISTNHTISTTFAINTFSIIAGSGTGGSITPSGSVLVNYGANYKFIITANPGYHIVAVMVDGTLKGSVASYTFTNVKANHNINASFAMNPRWDVNGDRVCNISDLILVSKRLGQRGTPGWIPEDVNNDGIINMSDINRINNYLGRTW